MAPSGGVAAGEGEDAGDGEDAVVVAVHVPYQMLQEGTHSDAADAVLEASRTLAVLSVGHRKNDAGVVVGLAAVAAYDAGVAAEEERCRRPRLGGLVVDTVEFHLARVSQAACRWLEIGRDPWDRELCMERND